MSRLSAHDAEHFDPYARLRTRIVELEADARRSGLTARRHAERIAELSEENTALSEANTRLRQMVDDYRAEVERLRARLDQATTIITGEPDDWPTHT